METLLTEYKPIVELIIAFIAWIVTTYLPDKYASYKPLFAAAIGAVVAIVILPTPWQQGIVIGIYAGLMAVGIRSAGNALPILGEVSKFLESKFPGKGGLK